MSAGRPEIVPGDKLIYLGIISVFAVYLGRHLIIMQLDLFCPGLLFQKDTDQAYGSAGEQAFPEGLLSGACHKTRERKVVYPDNDRSNDWEEEGKREPEERFAVGAAHQLAQNYRNYAMQSQSAKYDQPFELMQRHREVLDVGSAPEGLRIKYI